ncbi:MAG: penicillin-binding protein 2, partial [Rickettsiales bacterium]|nr:penicillin-binding protein 2 [Rickettsiales bacterium]
IETARERHYPLGYATAHITGYVGPASKEQAAKNRLYRYPGFRVGKTGVEAGLEETLQGQAGIRRLEVDALGTMVREISSDPGTKGTRLWLGVDSELQRYAMEILAGKGGKKTESAAMVILDIPTGDVLAMASVPSYDPNQIVQGISAADWSTLTSNPDAPLLNKTIAMQYPPGSTFKLVTALAGLEAGVVRENTVHECRGHIELGGQEFHCWNRDGHGHLNLPQAIAKSCNVYFYQVAQQLGIDRIAEMARRLGLGALTGIQMPGEKAGLVPDSAWKRKIMGQSWFQGETLHAAIGQGYLLATPIQLAVMVARVASGQKIMPGMVHQDQAGHAFSSLDIRPRHLEIVRRGMGMVVNSAEGTAYHLRIPEVGYAMGGKTGTVQTHAGHYKQLPGKRALRHHAVFVGFAPLEAPRYAISVLIEHGGYGASAAGPVARKLLRKVQGLA